MKKISLLGLCFSLASITFAQQSTTVRNGSPVQLGIKAGVNLASIDDDNSETNSKTGFHLGVLGHIHLSQNFALQPELVYSRQGADYEGPRVGEHYADYINVPIMLQYMTNGGFRLETGPQVGFLTDAKFENPDGSRQKLTNTNNIDFSWGFGAGYLNTSGFGVNARYNHGFTNMNEKHVGYNAQNRVIQLGIFYQFTR